MVAKTYQGWATYGEPFEENKKMYVVVVTPKGAHKKIRWYSEAEYAKMYPDAEPPRKKLRSLKDVLGFKEGYITIFKGDTYPLLDWFQQEPKCRYHCSFGWYCVSEEELPSPIPAGVEPVKLYWKDIANVEEDALKPKEYLKQHIESLLYDASPSQFQGKIGERIERELTVTRVLESDGYYGHNSFHIFSDAEGNVYTWNTSSKTLEVGRTYHLKGTVKEHTCFRNVNQTNLTRCAICQDK